MTKSYLQGGRRRKTAKKGGAGAAEYAIKVYGAGEQQHAGSQGNLIAANSVSGGSRKRRGKKGGNALSTVAVPALLIAANHLYKRNKTLKNYKKGGGPNEVMNDVGANKVMNIAVDAMQNLNNKISGGITEPPAVIQTGASAPPMSSFSGAGIPIASDMKTGGARKKVGAGAFAEIAVPAVLIAANRLYKKDKRAYGSNSRKNSKK